MFISTWYNHIPFKQLHRPLLLASAEDGGGDLVHGTKTSNTEKKAYGFDRTVHHTLSPTRRHTSQCFVSHLDIAVILRLRDPEVLAVDVHQLELKVGDPVLV